MRVLLQRVSGARVETGGETLGAIDAGVLVFAALLREDQPQSVRRMARKVLDFRLFADERGRMNRSVLETGGALLVVPQFTLGANTGQGNRPGFQTCAPPQEAEPLFALFVQVLQEAGAAVASGRFGAAMHVHLSNEGPVTFLLENT